MAGREVGSNQLIVSLLLKERGGDTPPDTSGERVQPGLFRVFPTWNRFFLNSLCLLAPIQYQRSFTLFLPPEVC